MSKVADSFPWRWIAMQPADGVVRKHVRGFAFVHKPKNAMGDERIIIKKGAYKYTIVNYAGRWTAPVTTR